MIMERYNLMSLIDRKVPTTLRQEPRVRRQNLQSSRIRALKGARLLNRETLADEPRKHFHIPTDESPTMLHHQLLQSNLF